MKREILFRGKRVDNGEWVEGSLYIAIYNTYIIQKHDETRTALSAITIMPETVGQFTGLTDKNGKRIFEGDICREDFDDKLYRVEFINGEFTLIRNYSDIVNLYMSEVDYGKEIKVIGNVHDNPELS